MSIYFCRICISRNKCLRLNRGISIFFCRSGGILNENYFQNKVVDIILSFLYIIEETSLFKNRGTYLLSERIGFIVKRLC